MGGRFVEKMVSLGGKRRRGPRPSLFSDFCLLRASAPCHEQTAADATRKSNKRYIPIPKCLVQNQNTSIEGYPHFSVRLRSDGRRRPSIPHPSTPPPPAEWLPKIVRPPRCVSSSVCRPSETRLVLMGPFNTYLEGAVLTDPQLYSGDMRCGDLGESSATRKCYSRILI